MLIQEKGFMQPLENIQMLGLPVKFLQTLRYALGLQEWLQYFKMLLESFASITNSPFTKVAL
jgi:hypothetical protein